MANKVRDRLVSIDAGDYRLRGRLVMECAAASQPAVLFLAGWSPRVPFFVANHFAPKLDPELKVARLFVSLRGMGSKGDIRSLTRSDFLDDVVAAYDFLASVEGVDPARIFIVGESFGAYMACLLIAKRPVLGVALRAPTDFPDQGFVDTPQTQIAGNASRAWKVLPHAPEESRALSGFSAYTGRKLVVAAEMDEFVPMQTTRNYLQAGANNMPVEFHLMQGASHSLLKSRHRLEYLQVLTRWLRAGIDGYPDSH